MGLCITAELAADVRFGSKADMAGQADVVTRPDQKGAIPLYSGQCLLLAQSGHPSRTQQCPLLGVKRTSIPQRTCSASSRRLVRNKEIPIEAEEKLPLFVKFVEFSKPSVCLFPGYAFASDCEGRHDS
jgi:hypothetical protein